MMLLGQDQERQRRRLCEEAARIMAEEGIRDYQLAKRKAAKHLSFSRRAPLPSNREIEQALSDRLRIFKLDHQAQQQRYLSLAQSLMGEFDEFSPRAVGAVLSGNVTDDAPVELHLFADTAEELLLELDRRNIPYELFDRRLRFSRNRNEQRPGVRFVIGDTPIEFVLFPNKSIREAPCSVVDGQPIERASFRMLEQRRRKLLGQEQA